MKLYTEEQVREAWNTAFMQGMSIDSEIYEPVFFEDFLKELTPIELPSDEEIEAHVEDDFLNASEVHKYSEEAQLLMKAMCKAGMKCMRDKIGGNK